MKFLKMQPNHLLMLLIFLFSFSRNAIAIISYGSQLEKTSVDQVEFFTEKNYQGNKFTVTSEGDYPIDTQIVIQSFKISGDFQIAFDFDNACCALENGSFKYLSVNSPDAYGDFGCSIDFSKIKKVYIRRTPRSLVNQILIYDKSFLMGDKKVLKLGAGNISVTLPIQSVIGSIQMPAYCNIVMFDSDGVVINNSVSTNEPINLYQMPTVKNFGFIGRVEKVDVKIETPVATPPSGPPKKKERTFRLMR